MPASIDSHQTLTGTQTPPTRSSHDHDHDKFPPADLESGIQEKSTFTPPNPNPNPNKDPNIVTFSPSDPENPYNWSTPYRSWITFQLGMLALAASLGSSIITPAQTAIATEFHLSHPVSILGVSLYVLGFAFGPLLWAPVSELWGRRISLIPAMFFLALFSLATGLSQTAATVFITRFLAGLFGSAPVSNVAAALGDLWSREARGTAITFYAIAVTGGPTIGPLIGSAIVTAPGLGWRWTMYILAIWTAVVAVGAAVCLPEVYAPVLLARKAQRLRRESPAENSAMYHPHETQKLSPRAIVTKHLARPLRMLFTEPMVSAIALYASFVFGLLYLTLELFPLVYLGLWHWGPVASTLPFLGLFAGVVAAVGINLGNQRRYRRLSLAANGAPVPEARCPPIVVGGVLFAAGLFWFGWTADPGRAGGRWAASVVATGFIGAGFNSIFQQCINFLVDTYGPYAASAVSANTFLRSILAAVFPLVAGPMVGNLGVGPAMSILGAVAAAMIPVPLLFMRFGKSLRMRSAFAREIERQRVAGA